jgi:two-component system KDP operon response regulator KdpE
MNASKPCVLVVDDEPQIRKMIEVTLTSYNFKVVEAESGNEALRLCGSYKPDVVILDLGLPDMDGTEVLERLREWSDMPVVVISARSDSNDIVDAFELGADDYMTKPFDMNVLLARINAAMKHSYQKELGESTLEVGGIKMDLIRHEVTVDGTLVEFSPKEYELLSFLMRNEGKMLTHRQILKEVWGDAHAHDKQYLRVYIMQVRQKMEQEPESPEYIVTEAGIGYRFDVPKKDISGKVA